MNKKYYQEAPKILQDFLLYSEAVRNKSARSVDEYFLDLRTFFRYLKIQNGFSGKMEFNEIPIDDVDLNLLKTVTLQDLYSFLVYCKDELHNNSTTRARKCSTLKIYFKYLSQNTKQLPSNPAELLESPKIASTLPKHLTLEEALELLRSVDGPNKERDFCILTLFLNCGMRLSELCNISLNDLNSEGALRLYGKGNKERIIYLNDACISAINSYLPVRPVEGVPASEKSALFISRNKRRISPKTVQHIVYEFLEKAGLGNRGFSAHKLRHTAATLMYQRGHADVRVIKDVLGHQNLGTTQIYTHVSSEQVKSAIEHNPLSAVKPKKSAVEAIKKAKNNASKQED